MEISIKLDDRAVTKKIQSLQDGVKSYKKPLESVGTTLIDFYGGEVFETQGKALGESWKELSAGTLMARANRTGYYAQKPKVTGKILIWTGRLQAGFKKQVENTRLTISNTVSYFKHHQLGQRKMLGITKDVITDVVNELNDYIKQLIK